MLGLRPIAAMPLADNGPATVYFVARSRFAFEDNSENNVVIAQMFNSYALMNACNQAEVPESINDYTLQDLCNNLVEVLGDGVGSTNNDAVVDASGNTYV